MRVEEVSDESWFALPEDGDEDVDWSSFTVDIEGPVSHVPAQERLEYNV